MGEYTVRVVAAPELPALVEYMEDHLSDNGRDGNPLFQPLLAGTPWPKAERLEIFRQGIEVPLPEKRWRRFWRADTADGHIAGHADLRARPEPRTEHRALLGMGVHRDHRRRGLGAKLVRTVLAWASANTELEWIDLQVLQENEPAIALYEHLGFSIIGRTDDMYRLGDVSVGDITMTWQISR